MSAGGRTIGVLSVDDNPAIGEGLEIAIRREGGLRWLGQLTDARDLARTCLDLRPDVVLLDIDMPGASPLEAAAALGGQDVDGPRTLAFSGHVRRDLIDAALAAGAWGYISKSDDMASVLRAVRRVAEGEFVLSADVEEALRR